VFITIFFNKLNTNEPRDYKKTRIKGRILQKSLLGYNKSN